MDLSTARHAFITGGASGIGLAVADALAARGVPVTIADIDAEELEKTLASRSGKLWGHVLDVRDRAAWARVRDEAEAALGPVDVLMNNAGIAPDGVSFSDIDPASFDRMIAINLTGVFNGMHTFGKLLRERGRGHVVNTASTAGITFSYPGAGAYTAAKHAVVSMTETFRAEMEPFGVGVSVLCPGLIDTNLGKSTAKLKGEPVHDGMRMPPGAADPAMVGDLVVKGIEQNQPYILTHPGRWKDTEKWQSALADAFAQAGAN